MSHPSQDYNYKKRPELKQSKSQGWSWPHLVSVQPKKSATASLCTPDEETEISPTEKKEGSVHQHSSPRRPLSPASSTTGSAAPPRETVVSEDQNIQQAESEIKENAEKNVSHGEDNLQHNKDANYQHVEQGAQDQRTEEKNVQHAEDDSEVTSAPEQVAQRASSCGDECVDNWTREPCNASNCDHDEESSLSSSDASAFAEEHTTHDKGAKRTSGGSESSMLHSQDTEINSELTSGFRFSG